MNHSDVNVQGPPLRPKRNARSRRTRKLAEKDTHASGSSQQSSAPCDSGSLHPHYSGFKQEEDPNPVQQPSPSEHASTETAPIETLIQEASPPPPLSPHPLLSYRTEDEPEMIARTYIQRLQVIHSTRDSRVPCPIPLCPFILAHIRPFVIPHFPLHIPSMHGYVFYLLHVLKETITTPTAPTTISYIAVFSMTNTEKKTYHTLGTCITEQHVEQIQRNIQEEANHLKERIIEYGKRMAS
jgi:hypothetical protein